MCFCKKIDNEEIEFLLPQPTTFIPPFCPNFVFSSNPNSLYCLSLSCFFSSFSFSFSVSLPLPALPFLDNLPFAFAHNDEVEEAEEEVRREEEEEAEAEGLRR